MDIDIVVLWVDGNDPEWQKQKEMYAPKKRDDSNSDNRFRDWGLMKYWFRAIEQFAPWVRTIHFVTWGHLPPFLNVSHPKLHIVRHEDYIPSEWLPTFNACAIEMNIQRIENLAEHFIFFNDDMFLTQQTTSGSFFKDGFPCMQATEIPLGFVGKTQVWQHLAANDIGIINKWFNKKEDYKLNRKKYLSGKYNWYDNLRTCSMRVLFPQFFTGFKNFHMPSPFLKSTFISLWEREAALLAATSSHRFRSREDVNQWLAVWWQLAEGKFVPRKMDSRVFSISEDSLDEICDTIKKQKYEMICLNDPSENVNFEVCRDKIVAAFDQLLPQKCSFEL